MIGDVRTLNPEEEAARDRLEALYASFGTITPVVALAWPSRARLTVAIAVRDPPLVASSRLAWST